MYHFYAIALYVLIAVRFGDWKNWRKYYLTIQLYILGDFAYNFLLYKHPLWEYRSPGINHTILDLLYAGLTFPSIVLVVVPHVLRTVGFYRKAIILLFWSLFAWIIEYYAYKHGLVVYFNGWNPLYTFLFYIALRLILILHYKRPLWGAFVSTLCGIITIWYFHLSILK